MKSSVSERDNKSLSEQQAANEDNNFDLTEMMKNSFKFWNKKYKESMINYPLVWKKAIESNVKIMEKVNEFSKNNAGGSNQDIQQFLDEWYYAIRKSNFDLAEKSMERWQELWKNSTSNQIEMYREILDIIEKYWKDVQGKNIE